MWRLFTYMEHIYSIPYHDFTCHQKCSCALKKAQNINPGIAFRNSGINRII